MNDRRAACGTPAEWSSPSVAMPISRALESGAVLGSLMARLRESQARYDALKAALPDVLEGSVRPGPVDDQAFTLLAANGAVGAKLRQMLPALDAALDAAGWAPKTIRVKIRSG